MIYIPDTHGRPFVFDALMKRQDDEDAVLLGDYLEPYPDENISNEMAIEVFEEILDIKKENPDKIHLLLGNHDFACIDKSMITCRHDYKNAEYITKLFHDNLDLFDIAYEHKVGDRTYVLSHAGFHLDWIDALKRQVQDPFDNKDVVKKINQYFHEDYTQLVPVLHMYSHFRGHGGLFGSCVWADVREYMYKNYKYEPIYDGCYQVFGHTQLISEPIIREHFACIDCRCGFRLNEETLTLERI